VVHAFKQTGMAAGIREVGDLVQKSLFLDHLQRKTIHRYTGLQVVSTLDTWECSSLLLPQGVCFVVTFYFPVANPAPSEQAGTFGFLSSELLTTDLKFFYFYFSGTGV
jgi:hypothetical protein